MLRFLFSLLLLPALAQAGSLSDYLIPSPDSESLVVLSQLFEVGHRDRDGFHIIVPEEQTDLFRLLAPRAILVDRDISATVRSKLARYRNESLLAERYHSFDEVQAWMKSVESAHPAFVKQIPYGLSQGSRPLVALQVGLDENKPALMITAATHGDEVITTEVLMALVNQLVEGYGRDRRFTQMIDGHRLYFIPVVNVDGFIRTDRYETGRDPNRSYPYPGHEAQSPTPSIRAVINFFQARAIAGSIDFHAYGELIMYPWAYTHDPVPSATKSVFDRLTSHMAETNRYTYGPISDVIYVAPGSSADFYFWKKGSLSLGIEMGQDKAPDPSEFPAYVDSQAESTWRFIEAF